MFKMFVGLLLFLCFPCNHGYSTGPPTSACSSMTPSHGVSPQSTTPPYTITASSSTYQRGQNITVTLSATNPGSSPFKGFLLQARAPGSTVAIGRFYTLSGDTGVRLMSCSGGLNNAVSHTSSEGKTLKQFIWTGQTSGSVLFQATFVKTKSTFWTRVTSSTLSEATTTTTTTTTTTPTTTTTTTTTTTPTTTTTTTTTITTTTTATTTTPTTHTTTTTTPTTTSTPATTTPKTTTTNNPTTTSSQTTTTTTTTTPTTTTSIYSTTKIANSPSSIHTTTTTTTTTDEDDSDDLTNADTMSPQSATDSDESTSSPTTTPSTTAASKPAVNDGSAGGRNSALPTGAHCCWSLCCLAIWLLATFLVSE